MESETYETHSAAVRKAVEHLSKNTTANPKVIERLVELGDVVGRNTQPLVGDSSINVYEAHSKVVRYVIRDDLLCTMENFLDLLKQAAGLSIGIFSLLDPQKAALGVKSIVDAIHGLAVVYRKLIALGFRPSAGEFAVFAALKENPQSNSTQLATAIKAIEADDIENILLQYQQTSHRQNGFTQRDAEGRWQLVGY